MRLSLQNKLSYKLAQLMHYSKSLFIWFSIFENFFGWYISGQFAIKFFILQTMYMIMAQHFNQTIWYHTIYRRIQKQKNMLGCLWILNTFTHFYSRSKSCKKDLWAQINTALQANTKWQRPDVVVDNNMPSTSHMPVAETESDQAQYHTYYRTIQTLPVISPGLPSDVGNVYVMIHPVDVIQFLPIEEQPPNEAWPRSNVDDSASSWFADGDSWLKAIFVFSIIHTLQTEVLRFRTINAFFVSLSKLIFSWVSSKFELFSYLLA